MLNLPASPEGAKSIKLNNPSYTHAKVDSNIGISSNAVITSSGQNLNDKFAKGTNIFSAEPV